MVSLADVEKAYSVISPHIEKTPLLYADSLSRLLGASIWLKCENLQRTGSFKARGAFNKLSSIKGGKVIAASMGNHAQGVAYAASALGLRAKIVMPKTVSAVKEEAVRSYGAEVALCGESLSDALLCAKEEKGYAFIHPYDDEEIIAGQGTIGIEIFAALRDRDIPPDMVIVPVGGGGLIAGISVALKSIRPGIKVIGVQAEVATSALHSFREKRLIERPAGPTIADGIAVGRAGELTLPLMEKFVDDIEAVPESSIAHAISVLLERKKLVAEGAGAAPLAYCFHRRDAIAGKNVILVLSGGNIDFTIMDRVLHRGLIEAGRVGVVEAVIDDLPGSLYGVTGIIAGKRGNILDISHNRLSPDVPIGKTKVGFTIEVKGRAHLDEITSEMKRAGIKTIKPDTAEGR